MNIKGWVTMASVMAAFGVKSPVMERSAIEAGKGNNVKQRLADRLRKSVLRKYLGEELIVFSAVASAYLLAWAASRIFQQ